MPNKEIACDIKNNFGNPLSHIGEENLPDCPKRYDWSIKEILALMSSPLPTLLFRAMSIHKQYRQPTKVQAAQLLSIKTGGCAEDCGYCSQSAKHKTSVEATKLMALEEVKEGAKKAKENGASRFCMGAAWRSPKGRDMYKLTDMIKYVKSLGLETCMTLGMLDDKQAQELSEAGLDYYNHNIDTSPEFYSKIIGTRTFDDRLKTLEHARKNGLKLCTGGILGMGESDEDRASMLRVLNSMQPHPESVPINALIPIKGTPLENQKSATIFEIVRVIAAARIILPNTSLRLSAGRESMSDEGQAMCIIAGADSIFIGDTLLTAGNPNPGKDIKLAKKIGIEFI